ncbi:MAG: DUF2171 domain-containing protein [Chloroflexota bacterium]|nr:DUF2171 domain-containing protein [Chloroflexota bacterium]
MTTRDAGMVVGVFSEPARAEAAVEALTRAGFPPEAITLVEPDPADVDLLAELTEVDADEWREELERIEGALVTVSGIRRDEARAILQEHGAEDVMGDDEPVSPTPATAPGEAGGHAELSAAAQQVRPGMLVVGSDYARAGRVKRIEGDELLLDRRPLRRDIWLPLDAVDRLIGQWVVLTLPSDQVDPMEPFMRPRIGERPANPGPADGEEQA